MNKTIEPWYKQFWPWVVFGIPGLTIFAGLVTVYIAFSDPDGLVSDDYYKDGLGINADLARDENAKQLGIKALCQLQNGKLTVRLSSTEGAPFADTLELKLIHTTRASFDKIIELKKDSKQQYSATLPTDLKAGSWILKIETEHWRIRTKLKHPFPANFEI